MRVLNKFEVELVEVCCNVDTLQLVVVVLVHEYKVGVNFKSTIFSQNNSNLVTLFCLIRYLANSSVLKKGRNSQL